MRDVWRVTEVDNLRQPRRLMAGTTGGEVWRWSEGLTDLTEDHHEAQPQCIHHSKDQISTGRSGVSNPWSNYEWSMCYVLH